MVKILPRCGCAQRGFFWLRQGVWEVGTLTARGRSAPRGQFRPKAVS